MNESILLDYQEALRRYKQALNNAPSEFVPTHELYKAAQFASEIMEKNAEAIKKWEDSSGKETGMKWVKASERLPEVKKLAELIVFREVGSSWKNFNIIFWNHLAAMPADNFRHRLENKFSIKLNKIEWLDESVPPYKEEVSKRIDDKTMQEIKDSYKEEETDREKVLVKGVYITDTNGLISEHDYNFLSDSQKEKCKPYYTTSIKPYKEEVDKGKLLKRIEFYLGGWREAIGLLEDHTSDTIELKNMMAAINQIDEIKKAILESKEEAGMKDHEK